MAPNPQKSTVVTGGQQTPDAGLVALAHLRELIAAVDARIPHLERAGEVDIARDAARLRREAVERIARIERSGSDA